MNESNLNSDPPKKNTEGEVDLGMLFNMLIQLFKNIASGITSIFTALFRSIIFLIIYFKKYYISFLIAVIIGSILGGIHQFNFKESHFTSTMTVQANYESIIQLYKDMEYCQNLIKEKDHKSLANYFEIDSLEATSIKKIKVVPYTNSNQIVLTYNDFISKLDSSVIKHVDFERYSENIPKEQFLLHIIEIETTDRNIFSKFEKPIINSLSKSPYYSQLLETEIRNLKSQENVLNITMIELDSLRQFYKELSLNESKKENGATNFYLGDAETDNQEIVVFDKYIQANIDLIEVRSEINIKNEIINVVSSFNSVGAKVSIWYRNSLIMGFLGGFFIILLALIVLETNSFINKFEKSNDQSKLTN